jgi:hypothetical protein
MRQGEASRDGNAEVEVEVEVEVKVEGSKCCERQCLMVGAMHVLWLS